MSRAASGLGYLTIVRTYSVPHTVAVVTQVLLCLMHAHVLDPSCRRFSIHRSERCPKRKAHESSSCRCRILRPLRNSPFAPLWHMGLMCFSLVTQCVWLVENHLEAEAVHPYDTMSTPLHNSLQRSNSYPKPCFSISRTRPQFS